MTKRQAKWAQTHDWWVMSCEDWDNDWEVTVKNDMGEGLNTFDNFEALVIWAGY